MNRTKAILVLGLIALLLLYFFPRGFLTPTNTDTIDLKTEPSGYVICPPNIRTTAESYQEGLDYFVNFTLLINGTAKANVTLKGPVGKHLCTHKGVLVYAYYPGDWYLGIDAAFFDYNLTLKWKQHLPGVPYRNTQNGLILVSNPPFGSSGTSCVYVVNISTGLLRDWICPGVIGGYISDVKIFGGRVYLTAGLPTTSPLTTHAILYTGTKGTVERKTEITSIAGEGVGIRLLIDVNEKYVAVAYFLANEREEEKNGVCVFKSNSLRKIACKEFEENENPVMVKLEGSTVYVKTTKGAKAYKILSLW